MEILCRSAASGLMISIGATVYLTSDNKVIGAFLFAVGLFAICSFGMKLFTGSIGYVVANKSYAECGLIWLGNLIGCVLASSLLRLAKPQLAEAAHAMMEAKLANPLPIVLILAFFCGVLMYIAVDNYRSNPSRVEKVVGIFICIPVFILCGFEHSVADMSYFVFAVTDFAEAARCLLFLLVVSVGNGLGALAVRALSRSRGKAA